MSLRITRLSNSDSAMRSSPWICASKESGSRKYSISPRNGKFNAEHYGRLACWFWLRANTNLWFQAPNEEAPYVMLLVGAMVLEFTVIGYVHQYS